MQEENQVLEIDQMLERLNSLLEEEDDLDYLTTMTTMMVLV